jgi:hypothetical protein
LDVARIRRREARKRSQKTEADPEHDHATAVGKAKIDGGEGHLADHDGKWKERDEDEAWLLQLSN